MPTKSKAQKHLMQAVEHNAAFAKKVGIPQKVAKEMLHPKKKAPDTIMPKMTKKEMKEHMKSKGKNHG